jgi:hypothetical protein
MARMNSLLGAVTRPGLNVMNALSSGLKFANALTGSDEEEYKKAYYEALTERARSGDEMTPKDEAMIRYYDALGKNAATERPPVDKMGAAVENAIAAFERGDKLTPQQEYIVRNKIGNPNPISGRTEDLPAVPGPTPTPVPTQSIPAPEVPVSQAAPPAQASMAPPVQPGAVMPSGRQEPPTQTLQGSRVPKVSTPEEAMALPPGTVFEGPDGKLRTRP